MQFVQYIVQSRVICPENVNEVAELNHPVKSHDVSDKYNFFSPFTD